MPPYLPPVGRNLVNQRKKKTGAVVSNAGGSVPNEITCFICKKSKPRSQYANRQLQKFSDTIYNPYAPGGRCLSDPKTTCRNCTPQQVTELCCIICTKTKGLSYFAKNQRKNPSEARCLRCVQMHLETEPDYEPPDSDDYAESDSTDNEDFDDADTFAKPNEKPKIRRVVGARLEENNPPDNSSTSSTLEEEGETCRTSVPSAEDGWEVVTAAGNRPVTKLPQLPSLHGTSSTFRQSSVATTTTKKKPGWAKPEKVAKGQEVKWGQVDESDQWDQYARQLTNRRDANKKPSKRRHDAGSDTDEDWD